MDYWEYIKLAADILRPLPKQTILEVGCGDGRVSDYISLEYPEANVVGIDVSSRAIAFAQLMGRHAKYRHVNLYDINDSYDIVLLIEVLEHIPKQEIQRFLSKIRTLLKPNGSLVLSVPTPRAPMWHPGHVQHFTVDSLTRTLSEANLRIVQLAYHLDVRLSRYSRGWRTLLRFCDNRIYTIKPFLRVLGALHWHYSLRASPKHAARIVARVTNNI